MGVFWGYPCAASQAPAEPHPAPARSVQVPKPGLGVKGEHEGSCSFGGEGSSSRQPTRFLSARTRSPCRRARSRKTLKKNYKKCECEKEVL